MRILLDEDVHVKVMDWLTKRGHDVLRVPSGLKNGAVLELAQRESRVLLTRDKDFSNRLMYPPFRYKGIVILRIHPPELERLLRALERLLSKLSEVEFPGKTAIVEEQGYHLTT